MHHRLAWLLAISLGSSSFAGQATAPLESLPEVGIAQAPSLPSSSGSNVVDATSRFRQKQIADEAAEALAKKLGEGAVKEETVQASEGILSELGYKFLRVLGAATAVIFELSPLGADDMLPERQATVPKEEPKDPQKGLILTGHETIMERDEKMREFLNQHLPESKRPSDALIPQILNSSDGPKSDSGHGSQSKENGTHEKEHEQGDLPEIDLDYALLRAYSRLIGAASQVEPTKDIEKELDLVEKLLKSSGLDQAIEIPRSDIPPIESQYQLMRQRLLRLRNTSLNPTTLLEPDRPTAAKISERILGELFYNTLRQYISLRYQTSSPPLSAQGAQSWKLVLNALLIAQTLRERVLSRVIPLLEYNISGHVSLLQAHNALKPEFVGDGSSRSVVENCMHEMFEDFRSLTNDKLFDIRHRLARSLSARIGVLWKELQTSHNEETSEIFSSKVRKLVQLRVLLAMLGYSQEGDARAAVAQFINVHMNSILRQGITIGLALEQVFCVGPLLWAYERLMREFADVSLSERIALGHIITVLGLLIDIDTRLEIPDIHVADQFYQFVMVVIERFNTSLLSTRDYQLPVMGPDIGHMLVGKEMQQILEVMEKNILQPDSISRTEAQERAENLRRHFRVLRGRDPD